MLGHKDGYVSLRLRAFALNLPESIEWIPV